MPARIITHDFEITRHDVFTEVPTAETFSVKLEQIDRSSGKVLIMTI